MKFYGLKYARHVSPEASLALSSAHYIIHQALPIEARYHGCGIILFGDLFEKCSRLSYSFKFKQIVDFPTRDANTLDPVFTKLKEFYGSPIQRPASGLSDHCSIDVQPLKRTKQSKIKTIIKSQDIRLTNRFAMSTYLEEVNTKTMIDGIDTCEGKLK